MALLVRDFDVDCGGSFEASFRYSSGVTGQPYDLTGYTAEMTFKDPANPLSPPPLTTLTHSAGITLGGAAGTIAVLLTDEQTEVVNVLAVKYRLRIIRPDGFARVFAKGTLNFEPS
jgi:hypothetical protein